MRIVFRFFMRIVFRSDFFLGLQVLVAVLVGL